MLLNKHVPLSIIVERSKRDSQDFYLDPPVSHSDADADTPPEPPKPSAIDDRALKVGRVWLSHKHGYFIQSEVFGGAGITSGSQQLSIKRHMLTMKWIRVHLLAVGRSRVIVWEPLPVLYETLDLMQPQRHSRGGYLHQFLAHHAKAWAITQGYSITLEERLPNGKAVDAILRRPLDTTYLEIACSPPMEKEVNNLARNLESGHMPDRQVVAVLDKKSQKRLEELIAHDPRLTGHRARISVILAGSFLQQPKMKG